MTDYKAERDAARVAGLDRQPTVTQQRLEGRELPWAREGLAAPLVLPGIERKSDEGSG